MVESGMMCVTGNGRSGIAGIILPRYLWDECRVLGVVVSEGRVASVAGYIPQWCTMTKGRMRSRRVSQSMDV